MSVYGHDDFSLGSTALEYASLSSTSSRSILKRKTVEESLSSDFNNYSSHHVSLAGTTVTFDTVEISEHPITLGVNPSVADGGPPIEIGWESQFYELTSVDDFEQARAAQCLSTSGPRTVRKFAPEQRVDLLVRSGFSRLDLEKNEDDMSCIRLMREMTKRQSQRAAALANESPPASSKSFFTKRSSRDRSTGYGKLMKRFRLRHGQKLENTEVRQ